MSLQNVFFVFLLLATGAARVLVDGHALARDHKYFACVLPVLIWRQYDEFWPLIQRRLSVLPWLPFLICSGIIFCVAVYFSRYGTAGRNQPPDEDFVGATPYLLPCRTTHTRLFPQKHAFGYSYLQVAIPVGWKGCIGWLLAVDSPARAWFAVRAGDYLDRGKDDIGLKAKLDAFLRTQDIDPAVYDAAWLVTAPRFAGYAFNPVSFWYLYHGRELQAMILEVNNTFDERRMYFLPRNNDSAADVAQGAAPAIVSSTEPFTASWPKDFHVSPFNSRKGAYALSAQPFSVTSGITNTITLSSSKSHAKLVARVFSTSTPIAFASLSTSAAAPLILRWSWVGFVTYPRIVAQAAWLFFRKRLHVWFRPEVTQSSISRNETGREAVLEQCWRGYLTRCIEEGDRPVRYIAAGNALPHEVRLEPRNQVNSAPEKPLDFQVLTPQFYADLSIAPSIAVYLRQQAAAKVEHRTYSCNDIGALISFFQPSRPTSSPQDLTWRFRVLSHLRPRQSPDPHDLDRFTHAHLPSAVTHAYARAATALLLSQRVTFGMPELLDAVIRLARVAVVYWCWKAVLAPQLNVQGAIGWLYFAGISWAWWEQSIY